MAARTICQTVGPRVSGIAAGRSISGSTGMSESCRNVQWCSSTFAAGSDDAGFWPVTRLPSMATCGCQFLRLRIHAAVLSQHVLDQERHCMREPDGCFFRQAVARLRPRRSLY
jgi:hypothetical protein